MVKIEFNAAFRTDKAGRPANQDNGFCIPDLSSPGGNVSQNINTDRTIQPGPAGSLFVVADGMGGMNAGEKASELIVKGMQKAFGAITADVAGDSKKMTAFLTRAITNADKDVKEYAQGHPETRGMGSTIVALWICGDMAVAAWVGDSRIYRFNPENGLVRLSHDHSYVQGLVDSGRLPEHMAFDHPDSNIITRSLGDNSEPAKPETRVYQVYDRDEFLLCSDGLCGLLTDQEIETVMMDHGGSSKATLDSLWDEGEKKGWSDNATIEVVCVTGELHQPAKGKPEGYPEAQHPKPRKVIFGEKGSQKSQISAPAVSPEPQRVNFNGADNKRRSNMIYVFIGAALILVCAAVATYFLIERNSDKNAGEQEAAELTETNDDNNATATRIRELLEIKKYVNEQTTQYKGNLGAMPSDIKGKMAQKLQQISDGCNRLLEDGHMNEHQETAVKSLLEYARDCQRKLETPATVIIHHQSTRQTPSTTPAAKQPARQPTPQTTTSPAPAPQPEQAPVPTPEPPKPGPEKPATPIGNII